MRGSESGHRNGRFSSLDTSRHIRGSNISLTHSTHSPRYALATACSSRALSRKGVGSTWSSVNRAIESSPCRSQITRNIEFIDDAATEIYFKAADVLVLPYREVFQSGVLLLSYRFGLPVIATDVGSLED